MTNQNDDQKGDTHVDSLARDAVPATGGSNEAIRALIEEIESHLRWGSSFRQPTRFDRESMTLLRRCLAFLRGAEAVPPVSDAQSEIARLTKERDEAIGDAIHAWSEVDHQRGHKDEYARMLEAAEQRIAVLSEYAQHKAWCPANQCSECGYARHSCQGLHTGGWKPKDCTCGLADLLAGSPAPTEK